MDAAHHVVSILLRSACKIITAMTIAIYNKDNDGLQVRVPNNLPCKSRSPANGKDKDDSGKIYEFIGPATANGGDRG